MNIIHLFLIVFMVAMWNYRENVADMTMKVSEVINFKTKAI